MIKVIFIGIVLFFAMLLGGVFAKRSPSLAVPLIFGLIAVCVILFMVILGS